MMTPIWISLVLPALIKLAVAFAVATAAARVRYSASRGLRTTLDVIFLLPLVLPANLNLFCSCDTSIAEVIAVLPVLYVAAALGFRKVSREAIDAARLQGLGRCGTFWRLFFPAAWRWLLGGFLIVALRIAFSTALLVYQP